MGKKKNTASTPATLVLDTAGISYTAHSYTHDAKAASFGGEAAEQLGVSPQRVFKTLMVCWDAAGSTEYAVAVVPAAGKLDLKALGAVLGAKKLQLAPPAAAQRRSGYVVGGISAFGQRTPSITVIDASAMGHETIFISGGRRGFSLEIAPADAVRITEATLAEIATA